MGASPSVWVLVLATCWIVKGAMATTSTTPNTSLLPLTQPPTTSLSPSIKDSPPTTPSLPPSTTPSPSPPITLSPSTSITPSPNPVTSASPNPSPPTTPSPSPPTTPSPTNTPSSSSSSSSTPLTHISQSPSSTTSFTNSSIPTTEKHKRDSNTHLNSTEENVIPDDLGKINLVITSGNEVQVFWQPFPVENSSYEVEMTCARHHNCCGPCRNKTEVTHKQNITLTGEPGTDYKVRVRANYWKEDDNNNNNNRSSKWSETEVATVSSTDISCEKDVSINPFSTYFRLDLKDPCPYTGNQISEILLEDKKRSEFNTCSHNETIEELDPFTSYTVKVVFYDGIGNKTCYENATTLPDVPSMPTNLRVTQPAFNDTTIKSRQALITWNRPNQQNGELKHYMLTYYSNTSQPITITIPGEECTGNKCTYECELKPESWYSFKVTAENIDPAGKKSPPATYNLTTEAGTPFFTMSKPLRLDEASVTHNSITLLLNGSSISNDNGKVTSCKVRMKSGCDEMVFYSPIVYCIRPPLDREFRITIDEENPSKSDCLEDVVPCHLESKRCYSFMVTIHTSKHYTKSNVIEVITGEDPAVIASISVLTVTIILLLGIIGAYIIYTRRYKPIHYLNFCRRLSESIDIPLVVPPPPDVTMERRILLSDLPATVERLFSRGSIDLHHEYDEIKSMNILKSCTNAQLPGNRAKTRYYNILPYDETRVVLKEYPNNVGSNFINASYIHGHSVAREFIACQGPLNNTVGDFWRMVWEKNVHIIVMVTQCIERNKEKCNKYWPDVFKSFSFGDITLKVRNLHEQVHHEDGYIHRILQLSKRHKMRSVQQFQFVSWPDMGCPATPDTLINFVKTVKNAVPPESSHVVVHCSAGVGRTGTFIGLSNLMEEMSEQDSIDVFHTVYRMRLHRTNMVQTMAQYSFLYECVLKYYLDQNGQSQSWSAMESRMENKKVIPDVINGALGGPQHVNIDTISQQSTTTEEE